MRRLHPRRRHPCRQRLDALARARQQQAGAIFGVVQEGEETCGVWFVPLRRQRFATWHAPERTGTP